ncbi:hypothetical protein E9531_15275 [Lampropedia puyangensis]|uniref:Transposase InsH N-terminal domain-containing protein n=1 Tax=Lampropedia puyangensis TaxID=1330072 RepID=A0A4S8EW07_9BURK|nr:hypothetical protein E9531_15275 [Lampropedia puyangensis]
MTQTSLGGGVELSSKRACKREFLEEMERAVPWAELVALVQAHQSPKGHGRPSFAIENMLRIHFLQQWFNLSDPAMERCCMTRPFQPLRTARCQQSLPANFGNSQRHSQREKSTAAARHGG